MHAQCSETFPCEQCQQLFEKGANRHSDFMVQGVPWTCCVDTDLSKLNFFHQVMLFCVSAINQKLIFVAAILDMDIADAFKEKCSVVDKSTSTQSLGQYLQRVKPHAGNLMLAVEELAEEAGIHHLLGIQMYRSALLDQQERILHGAPLLWLMPLLSQEPLNLPLRIRYRVTNPSLAWILAAVMLFPDYFNFAAKLSDREKRDFVVKIGAAFFASTMKMLKDAKSKNIDLENRSMLNEQLMTL